MFQNSKVENISANTDVGSNHKHSGLSDKIANLFPFVLAAVLVYSVAYMVFFKPKTQDTNIMLDSLFTTNSILPGGQNEPSNEIPAVIVPDTTEQEETDAETASAGTTAQVTEKSTAVPATEKAPEKTTAAMMSTNAEIVQYYKDAVKKVKSSAKSVSVPWKTTTNYNGIVETGNSDMLAGILKTAMQTYMKPETSDVQYTSGADINNQFPPKAASSNLTVSDIKTATCTEKDGFYYITLVTKAETNPRAAYGIGSIFNIVSHEEITEKSPITISNLRIDYDSGTLEAKIEKSTGNIVSVKTKLPSVLNLTALKINCKLGLQFEESWEVKW